ncbi:MAG: flagellar export chaperone FliS [Bdellovibrionota bacterium]
MSNKAFKVYQQTSVTTAKPDKILLMLYEGCIKFIRIAKGKIQEKKIAEKGKNISKALAIVSELINTLDHEVGGQLARDLEALYMFMMDKLIEANLHNRIEDLEVVEKLLTTLYAAWTDVIANPRPDGVPSPTLQPELYTLYKSTQQVNATAKQTQTNNSAASVNLSAEATTSANKLGAR